MAPKKKAGKEPTGEGTPAAKKPAQKKPTQVGKESGGAAKKPPPKKPVGKTPATIKKETKKRSTKATGKVDTVIKDEEMPDKPAGNTRSATKKGLKGEPTKPAGKAVTATATTTKSKRKPPKPASKTSATIEEPIAEPVDIPSEEDTPAASPKRKRKTEDTWTETTDLPVPKSPKLDEGSSLSSSRKSREIWTLEEFASEGWDTEDFDRELCCIHTVDLSRIPSPFANLADRTERFMHIIDNHTHPRVRLFFHRIHSEDTASLLHKLHGRLDGAFGALYSETSRQEFFTVRSDRPEFSLEVRKGDATIAGISFDIHIRKNARTGEIGYFVVNKEWDHFLVNEKHIGAKLAAGPLPDFAVIQIDRWVIFWWRTQAAMDYIPEAMSQVAKEVEEGGATKEPSPPPPNGKEREDTTETPSPPPSRVKKGDTAKEPPQPSASGSVGGETVGDPLGVLTGWEEVFHWRRVAHQEQQAAADDGHAYYQIDSSSGMTIDDVLFAVATVWEPLGNRGTHFAFAGLDVFDHSVQQMDTPNRLQGSGVVGGGNIFIMPLLLSPPDTEDVEEEYTESLEKKEQETNAKGKVKKGKTKASAEQPSFELGHFLLAVAEKGPTESRKVNITIFDSRIITLDEDVIRKRATELACIWLGTKVETEFVFRKVPQQIGNSNACGLYVVLNAWAIMLGIGPIVERSSRRKGCGTDAGFLNFGLNVVNLALAGFMDSRTIRAFLNCYGYTKVEEPLDQEDAMNNTVKAVRMDSERLERALQAAELRSPSSSIASAHSPGSTNLKKAVSESKLQQFMNLAPDATLEQAESFLATATGDVDKALMDFTKYESSKPDGSAGAEAS